MQQRLEPAVNAGPPSTASEGLSYDHVTGCTDQSERYKNIRRSHDVVNVSFKEKIPAAHFKGIFFFYFGI